MSSNPIDDFLKGLNDWWNGLISQIDKFLTDLGFAPTGTGEQAKVSEAGQATTATEHDPEVTPQVPPASTISEEKKAVVKEAQLEKATNPRQYKGKPKKTYPGDPHRRGERA